MTTRWTSLKNSLSLVAATLLLGTVAHAQLDGEAQAPAAKPAASSSSASDVSAAAANSKKAVVANGKRTSIDFEDELIEGQTQKPELFYLLQKRQFNYKRMIRLRENFLPEMRKTAEEIQRKGSGE